MSGKVDGHRLNMEPAASLTHCWGHAALQGERPWCRQSKGSPGLSDLSGDPPSCDRIFLRSPQRSGWFLVRCQGRDMMSLRYRIAREGHRVSLAVTALLCFSLVVRARGDDRCANPFWSWSARLQSRCAAACVAGSLALAVMGESSCKSGSPPTEHGVMPDQA